MNKRLLALLLVLCTVLVSVPVFALPAIAAEAGQYEYSTSFGTDKYPVDGVYPDAAWGVYQYPLTNGVAAFGDVSVSELINVQSYYGELDKMVAGPSTVGSWNERVHFVLDNAATVGQFGAYDAANQIAVSSKAAAAIRYTAEHSGIVDINIDRLANVTTQSNGTFVYSVVINGVSKWTSEPITMTNGQTKGDIITDTTPEELKNLEVFKGDLVEFTILATSLNGDKTTWQGSGNAFFGTVNYSKVYKVTSFDTNKLPDTSGNYPDPAWGVYNYDKVNGAVTFGPEGNSQLLNVQSAQFDAANSQFGLFTHNTTTASGARAHLVLNNFNANMFNEPGQIPVGSAAAAAVRYTAEKSGVVDINIDRLANTAPARGNGGADETFIYSVYVNGQQKWSTQITTAGKALYGPVKTNFTCEDLQNIEVRKGDYIEFTIETGAANIWAGSGSIFFGSVMYKSEAEDVQYVDSASFNTATLPTASGVYPENWGIYAYKQTDAVASFGNANESILLANKTALHSNGNLSTSDGSLAWKNRALLILDAATDAAVFSEVGQLAVSTVNAGAIRYTAKENGIVDVSIDRLANTALNSRGNFLYSIVINGETKWSRQTSMIRGYAMGDMITDHTPEALRNIKISKGDLVEFTVQIIGGDISDGSIWDGSGNIFFGSVNYREIIAAPTANANVTVGTTLSSTASVVLPEGAAAIESGLYIDDVKTPGASAAILEGIAIKDIESESVSVQPYYVREDGFEIKGNVGTVTIAERLAKLAAEGNAIAKAVLNYAGAAQDYFGIEGTLSYTETTVGDYSDKAATVTNTLEGATANPTKLALILNATTSAQIKVVVPNAPAGAQLKVFANGNTDYVDLVVEEDGETYFMMNAIGVEYWNEQFELTVVDSKGNAISSTFTYGVSIYYNRMITKINKGEIEDAAALANLITAMMALYEAL